MRYAGLERQEYVEDLLAIAALLHIGNLAAASIRDTRLRDLVGVDRVVALDILRSHNSSDDEFANLEVDANFLLPSITRLPFGNTCVTTPATFVLSSSVRSTEPLPLPVVLESAVKMRVGTGVFMIGTFGLPKKLAMPESSVIVRVRLVSFSIFALSVMLTFTVRMSPTWCAR